MNKYEVITNYEYKGKHCNVIEATSYSLCENGLFIQFFNTSSGSNIRVASISVNSIQAIYRLEKDDE